MSNVGNLDIERGNGSVILRMRHLVQGHPGIVLADAEVATLIRKLEDAVKTASQPPPQLKTPSQKIPDSDDDADFSDSDWDIA
jgi:hypothetical protein